MIRLLMDKRYNPELIRWEDEAEKTFRLVRPDIIAQMWGKRANKRCLSYNNFARGLRWAPWSIWHIDRFALYHYVCCSASRHIPFLTRTLLLRYQYTTGALKPVPEKQLVYKCGPKALQFWRDIQRENSWRPLKKRKQKKKTLYTET